MSGDVMDWTDWGEGLSLWGRFEPVAKGEGLRQGEVR